MLMTKSQQLPLSEGLEQELLFSALSITSGEYEKFARKFLAQRRRKRRGGRGVAKRV